MDVVILKYLSNELKIEFNSAAKDKSSFCPELPFYLSFNLLSFEMSSISISHPHSLAL